MSVLTDVVVIIFSSLVIFFVGDKFGSASSKIGAYFNIPNSVKGATIDAISSSAPELLVTLFGLIVFGSFEIGVGTIVGSAIFNLLFIPALCVLIAKRDFLLGKEVIYREGGFYAAALLFLFLALLYSGEWGIGIALILFAGYVVYVHYIAKHIKTYHKTHKQKSSNKIRIKKELLLAFIALIFIGVSTYLLTGHSEALAQKMNVPSIIIGFTVVAVATSLPDGTISIASTVRGTNDDAISNMLGSNIFNIFVGLSIPVLIATLIYGPVEIAFHNLEIVAALFFVTLGIIAGLHINNVISRRKAVVFLLIFAAFQGYFIYLAL